MAIATKERRDAESISDVLKELRATPMSKISKRFFMEDVGNVKGVLLSFNDELFPHLPISEGDIAEKLSLFVDRSGRNATLDLLRLPEHGRSLSFNVKFSDKHGNVYNYIDVKGAGLPKKGPHRDNETIKKDITSGVWGLLEYWGAKADWDASNLMIKKGVKTSAPIAIIEIKELILKDGERKSIEELKKMGMIPQTIKYDDEVCEYKPVIYLRAFTEFMRFDGVTKKDLADFAKEHGFKSTHDYMDWWMKEVAKNLAKLHDLGKVHHYMGGHNLTLDGRIVDNDGVKNPTVFNEFITDLDSLIEKGINHLPTPWLIHAKEFKATLFKTYLENRKNISQEDFRLVELFGKKVVKERPKIERATTP